MAISLDQFAAELLGSAAEATVRAVPVVKKAAQNMKTQAQVNVLQSAPTHNAGAHRAINYDDPVLAGFRVQSEVGYDRDIPAGKLGNLLEYGGGGDHSPPHMDLNRAADSEEAKFEDAVRLMAERLL